MEAASNVDSILQRLLAYLDKKLENLEETSEAVSNQVFSHDQFWRTFEANTKLISQEATKLCLAFSKPPCPSEDECRILCNGIENAISSFIIIFKTFPKSRGLTIHEVLSKFVSSILLAVKELCLAAKTHRTDQLQKVGSIWERCEYVEKLPKDNKDAVCYVCMVENQLVEDARAELADAVQNDSQDAAPDEMNQVFMRNGIRLSCPNRWSEFDQRLLFSCLGLIKAYEVTLRKISTVIIVREDDNEHWVKLVDDIARTVKSSSEIIDDLVLSAYPPLNQSAVRDHAQLIKEKCKTILLNLENFEFHVDADKSWIAFAKQAVDHNWDIIRNHTQNDQT